MDTFDNECAIAARWIERYLANVREFPVLSKMRPGEVAALLPESAPESPEPFEAIVADFERIVMPGITHWNHPRFFAYFATSATPAGIAAEALAAALDVKAMLWRTSPAATELEEVVMRWLGRLLGLPDRFTGIIYDTASVGGFTALAAARESLDLGIREAGMAGRDLPVLRVYVTEHTHSHIEKGAIALGIGRDNVVRVPCDSEFAMDPEELDRALAVDAAAGYKAMCVVATVGTTSTTARDPVQRIAPIAERYGVWLHVDAAYAGAAAIVPEFRAVLDGVERADSIVVNPHKWLFTPMDCSALYVRDPEMLRRTFSLVPEYLRTPEHGVRNYMDYGLQLGRRFRALKLWFVLRHLGAEGIRERLRAHVALAQELARWIADEPGWEVLAPHPFSVVCFRYRPPQLDPATASGLAAADALNERIMETVNASGEMFVSHTKINGAFALRMAIGNVQTTSDDVRAAWGILREAARAA